VCERVTNGLGFTPDWMKKWREFLTAPLAQPTKAFFAAVNEMLGGSSHFPTTAERTVIKSLNTVETTNYVRQ